MYVKQCSYADATRYVDCLNMYDIPFEWYVDTTNTLKSHYIKVKTVEPGNIHSVCYTFLPNKDISWDEYSSDLYIRKTEDSKKIMAELQPKSLLSTFIHNIDHDLWYDLPFCKNGKLANGTSFVGYIRG